MKSLIMASVSYSDSISLKGVRLGHVGNFHHIDFSLHRREEGYANFIQEECIRAFGKGRHFIPSRRENSRSVVVDSSEAASRIVNLCGKGAAEKRLREDLMLLPPKKQQQILFGWLLGDGHTTSHGRFKQGIVVSGTSISRMLIEQMRMIALRCGYFASVNVLRAGGRRKRDSYCLLFTGDTARRLALELGEYIPEVHDSKREKHTDFKVIEHAGTFFVRITDAWIEEHAAPVYNLTVEDDHTYIVNGVGVANSIKGYDEYAAQSNFDFELPTQASWLNHPVWGITARWPIFLEPPGKVFRGKSMLEMAA
jgi:hypothetical protein